MSIAPGSRFGTYDIISPLGAGGMGEVYRAVDSRLKRHVAIKVLPPSLAADAGRLARFQREAELLAALNHPHIAAIYGVEEHAGSTGLIMELVEGPTLADVIAASAVPIAEALPILRQIAAALEAAHEQGIIHRDLKPANIKVRPDGTVKVLDFGLAKTVDAQPDSEATASPTMANPAATMMGAVMGTAAYMSPEQARGRPVDKRADIWAFGVVSYEMLTGVRPFAGDDISDTIASVLARHPDWSRVPADVPPTLLRFLQRCLEKDAKQRVRDIGDIRLALDGAFDVTASTVASPSKSSLARALPIAATMVVAVVGVALFMSMLRPPPAPDAPVSRFEVRLPESQHLQNPQRASIAISADGRTVAYRSPDGIRIRTLDALESRLLPGTGGDPSTAPFTAPFFSPDGQWVGYFADDGLKKVSIAGGSPVTVAPSTTPNAPSGALAFGASWTTDNTILFGHASGILRVSADGGTPQVIVPANKGEQLWSPQVLPGGEAVLFTVVRVSPSTLRDGDIAVHSLTSGERTVIATGASDARYVEPGYLLYGARHTLMSVAFDAKRLKTSGGAVPVAEHVQRPTGISAGGTNYAVSANGTLGYAVETALQRSLQWVNRDGTPGETITTVPVGPIEDPRLSPDGSRVLVTRDGDIWTYDLASGRANRVTKDGNSLMGAWDPSGTRIAYSTTTPDALEAWVVPADGSAAARQLTRNGGIVHVDSWSPDGRLVSVHRHALLGTAILMVDADNPDAPPIGFASGDVAAEGATFAADGRHVAYLSTDNGAREIFVRPFPGPGGRSTVSVNGGVESHWAPNGEVFYRNSTGDRMFSVMARTTPSVAVSRPELRFEGRYYVAPTGSPRPQYDVTADGRRFLMVTAGAKDGDNSARFVIVQNWVKALNQ